jgi:hypothetical protein
MTFGDSMASRQNLAFCPPSTITGRSKGIIYCWESVFPILGVASLSVSIYAKRGFSPSCIPLLRLRRTLSLAKVPSYARLPL